MEPRSFRVGVCSWSLGPTHPSDLIASLDAIGTKAVQLALVPCVDDVAWRGAIGQLRGAGVLILSGMLATVGEDYATLETIAKTGGVRPDTTWPATRALAQRVAALAGEAGVPLVTFHAGFIPHGRGAERTTMLGRLRDLADAFAHHGVAVAFETGQESAQTLADALHELDHPMVGVNFDPANMILYGMGDPVAAIGALAPWVRQVHIKDALPPSTPGAWGTEVTVGTGAVDWPEFLAAVSAIDRPLDLVIEREAGAARAGDARVALERLRAWCGNRLD